MKSIEDRLMQDAAVWRATVHGLHTSTAEILDAHNLSGTRAERSYTRRVIVPAAAAALAVGAIVAVVAVVTHGSASSSTTTPEVAGQPTSPASADTDQHSLSPSAEPSGGPVVLLTPTQASGLISTPWRLIQIAGSETMLGVSYVEGDGDCVTPVGFRVLESDSSVEVWALSRKASGRGACGNALKIGTGTVLLDTPLGSRTILHGPVNKAWTGTANSL